MKFKLHSFLGISIAALCAIGPAVPAHAAGQGTWRQSGSDWFYQNQNGSLAKGWLQDGHAWYYLDLKTGMMKNGWLLENGRWFYLQPGSGLMKTGWVNAGGQWYFMDKNSGAMRTGWVKDGNSWYYMTNSGAMKTGWMQSKGAWYYLQKSGAMATGWVKVGSDWYYMQPDDGHMVTGWLNDEYYLEPSGKMAVGKWVLSAAGDKEFYVNGDGRVVYTRPAGSSTLPAGPEQDKVPVYPDLPDQNEDLGSVPEVPEQEENPVVQPETPEQDKDPIVEPEIPDQEKDPDIQPIYPDQDEDGNQGSSTPSRPVLIPDVSKPVNPGKKTAPVSVSSVTGYKYQLYSINDTYYTNNSYSMAGTPFFIQTDNPDGDEWTNEQRRIEMNFRNLDPDKNSSFTWQLFVTPPNVNYTTDYLGLGGRCPSAFAVDGGYVIYHRFDQPGDYEICVEEYHDGQYETNLCKTVIHVIDENEAENQWIDDIIARNAKAGMTPFEKMDAIAEELNSTFRYMPLQYNGLGYAPIEKAGLPCFIAKNWDSMLSPEYFCKIANRVGGFSEVHDCYGDYQQGSAAWQNSHYLSRLTYNGETRFYNVCPLSDTAVMNVPLSQCFDFSDLTRLYPVK